MKWHAYPEYKASGVEWLDNVPQHWVVTRLRRCGTIQSGVTLGKEYPEELSESRPYLRVANVQDGYLDLTEIRETVVPSADASRFELRPGDVLMTEGGDFDKLGRGCVWHGQIAGCLHQNHIFAVRPDTSKLIAEYLSLAMTSNVGKYHFTRTSQQSTNLATTNQAKIKDFAFPLPPLSEQRAITDFLNAETARIDVLSARKQDLIDRIKEKRAALIFRAVTHGLPSNTAAAAGLDPAPPLKSTGIDWIAEVPRHWTLTRLRRCATIQTGVTLGKEYPEELSESRPYLRVANVQDGYLDFTEIKETVVLSAEASRFELRSGDVLMTEGGDFDKLGRGCVWYGEVAGCLHQNHIFAVRPDTRKLIPEYLSLAMTSDVGKHHFTRTAQQSTNLATTNQSKIKDFAFPLPPLPEQRAILDWMALQETRFRNVEGRMRDAIGELEEYRSALITAAVTGKIDVRGWQSGARACGIAASGASGG